ncbi:c-type cytochrome biogenesis protein CcsB, partial [Geobacillus sp. G4]
AILGPNEWNLLTAGRMEPILEMPAFIEAEKINTVIWSFITGTVLYLLIRLITRKKTAQLFHPFVKKINADFLDEISYRSVL